MSDVVAKRARVAWLLPLAAPAVGYAVGRCHRDPAMELSDEQRRQAIELAVEICASDLPSADCSAIASQRH